MKAPTYKKVIEMIHVCDRAKLHGRYILTFWRVKSWCNGIGAAWFPDWLRKAVTKIHPTLTPASWIHDVRYALGGSWWKRLYADTEFLFNGWKLARRAYAWDQLRRYGVAFQALWFFMLLRAGGAAAWSWREDKR